MTARAAPSATLQHLWRVLAFATALGIGWLGHRIEQTWRAPTQVEPTQVEPTQVEPTQVEPTQVEPTQVEPTQVEPTQVEPTQVEAQPSEGGPFAGRDERELLNQLRSLPVQRVKKGSGGRSLAFKLTFADGSAGYWKPEQRVSSANWYAEVAAYHLDRALGLGRVPPVVSRSVRWSLVAAAAEGDRRVPEVKIAKDGTVRGALVQWLPEKLVPAQTPPGWENWVRVEPFAKVAVTPYQRAAAYGEALGRFRARMRRGEPGEVRYTETPTPTRDDLPAALSDAIVFDFLTVNYDRWGGDNGNLLTLGPTGPLIFLDNGDGFSAGPPRRSIIDARLAPLQRFRKRTIDAVRGLDLDAFATTLAADPHGPLLDRGMLAGLRIRKDALLEHVATMQRRFGEAVYAW